MMMKKRDKINIYLVHYEQDNQVHMYLDMLWRTPCHSHIHGLVLVQQLSLTILLYLDNNIYFNFQKMIDKNIIFLFDCLSLEQFSNVLKSDCSFNKSDYHN